MSQKLEDLFLEALDLGFEERASFLDQACKGDSELRQAVEALLQDAEKAATLFSHPAQGPVIRTLEEDGQKAGSRIGNYELISQIGEGGFGVVWLADQISPIRRRVAVKVLKAGMDTREILGRFEAERQALARMTHPNIAQVFDAGETDTHRPYFVMEWVDGIPLTQFCDERCLDLNRRLLLFGEVCAAISHAHQKGIIHRDIKPSNILVSQDGENPRVKVIDFGIAKALEDPLTDRTLVTRVEQMIGTPSYMSPEQAGLGGLDIDTRSDIYALGILLYELLTGSPPFDGKSFLKAGHDEMRRIVREEEPKRPSTRLLSLKGDKASQIAKARGMPAEHLPRYIAYDLDLIVMKALEKSRDRRYSTVEAFGEDIQRFVANEPILARAPSWGYVISKFARRHFKSLLAGGIILLAVFLGAGISFWQAVRALRAEQSAEKRLQEAVIARQESEAARTDAENITSFLQDIFRKPDPNLSGREVKVVDALDVAVNELSTRFANQPVRRARMQETLAQTYEGIGLYPQAKELLVSALETVRKLDPPDTDAQLRLTAHLAKLCEELGYPEEALSYCEAWLTQLQSTQSEEVEALDEAYTIRNRCLFFAGRQQESLAQQKQRFEFLAERLGLDHERSQRAAKVLYDLQARLQQPTQSSAPQSAAKAPQPNQVEAERQSRVRDLEAERVKAMASPDVSEEKLYAIDQALAWAYINVARSEEGISLLRDQAERLSQKFGPSHKLTLQAERELAYYLWRASRFPQAEDLWNATITKMKAAFGPKHADTMFTQAEFADALYFAGKVAWATVLAKESVKNLLEVEPASRRTHHAMAVLARCHEASAQFEHSLYWLSQAGPGLRDDTFANLHLALLQVWLERYEEYDATRDRMLADTPQIWNKGLRADVFERTVQLACIAPLRDDKQAEQIRSALQRADEIHSTPNTSLKRNFAKDQWALVRCLAAYRLGDYAEVQKQYEAIRQIVDPKKRKSEPLEVATILQALSLHSTGQPEAAKQLFQSVLQDELAEPQEGRPPQGQPLPRYMWIYWNLLREAKRVIGS